MPEWSGVAGRRVVMTGATGGIGLAAAGQLVARGADLTIVARSDHRGRDAAAAIESASSGRGSVEVVNADLASLAGVRALAAELLERYPRIEALVNNAGAMHATRELTVDGLELTWAVNHVAPFLLTKLLLERLEASAPARIVTTASDAHKGARIPFDDLRADNGYGRRGFTRYGQSKLANILFTAELARRIEGTGVSANCFHPGLVATGFNRNNGALMNALMTLAKPFSRRPEKGAETLVWLVDSPDVGDISGAYFVDCKRAAPSSEAQDMDAARRLWEVTEQQTQPQPAR